MLLFRLASRNYAANDGKGASRYGGRWNLPGTAVIYTSSSRSLASLEVIAHHGAIPGSYQIVVVDVPNHLSAETLSPQDLPADWSAEDSICSTARLGTNRAVSLRTAILSVPSAVIPAERNYILNPLHPEFDSIRFHHPDTEYIDKRLRG